MASVPPSPASPSYRRRSLRLSISNSPSDAYRSSCGSEMTDAIAFSTKSSRTSHTSYQPSSPTTPRPRISSYQHRRKSSSRLSIGSYVSLDQNDGGLGNLADELENALDDDYEVQEHGFLRGGTDTDRQSIPPVSPIASHNIDLANRPASRQSASHMSPSNPVVGRKKPGHERTDSRYDRSDYGPQSDEDDEGLPPMLKKRIHEIENVTRMSLNTEETLSEDGGVIARTTRALQDLGPQASIENNLTRVITAYTSMATHRTHKTRDLFNQAHSILYGTILDLTEETRDLLLTDINNLTAATTITQHQNPLLSLQILVSQTIDLTQTLRSLADVIQESRISASAASRKLKTVKDMVDDMQLEQDLVETSMMLIQAGDWDRRCRERQAAATCREVVRGFSEEWELELDDRPWIYDGNGVVA